uniref:Uncharacterized protein n=1 Tax=Anguilla anguilla TaxID=7936 RepID=A0A0E9RPJ0_ANGAN
MFILKMRFLSCPRPV